MADFPVPATDLEGAVAGGLVRTATPAGGVVEVRLPAEYKTGDRLCVRVPQVDTYTIEVKPAAAAAGDGEAHQEV